jgi:hypothetical protein
MNPNIEIQFLTSDEWESFRKDTLCEDKGLSLCFEHHSRHDSYGNMREKTEPAIRPWIYFIYSAGNKRLPFYIQTRLESVDRVREWLAYNQITQLFVIDLHGDIQFRVREAEQVNFWDALEILRDAYHLP